ncbi:pilus assembly protein PilW [Pseudomonas flexibilis]|uniref:Type IV pilus assembly protein PilF n=1 Tax=Pseudomonas flexibilis TaxID=706570 RepID=A0A1N6NQN1_9PSED|nr:type IV pilus biogenesis/stability protein PilW [Pseudomonas flexibilis]KHL71093.1 pilus assembly protein PilW [Pseudomonas flexibilis]SIP94317.1 type IV pilus assembly protein PilF [Pseudomonas flexibilis]
MSLRLATMICLTGLLAGCMSHTSGMNPLSTPQGREQARDAYIQLGIGYLQKGASERAKEPLSKALEIDPNHADAHAALALVFQTQMEPALADQHYRKALAVRLKDARILNNYGTFLYEQKRYEQAYERYRQASEDTLYGERSRVFENLGLTAQALKRDDQAAEHFQRALRLNANRPQALLSMAELSYNRKDYVAARNYYERFTGLSEQNARSLLLGIRLARVFGNAGQAASYGLQLKRLYPASREYQLYLSEYK